MHVTQHLAIFMAFSGWFRDFLGEVKLYPIGKPLKLVIYYIWQDILFEDEYSLIVSVFIPTRIIAGFAVADGNCI